MFVADDMAEPEQAIAMLHEITHLILDDGEVEVNDRMEERIAYAMGRGLAEIIARNPGLVTRIEAALKRRYL